MTDHHYIAIALPMPIDVFVTLGALIDKAWPGASIVTDPQAADVPQEVRARLPYGADMALLRVPKRAPKHVSKRAARAVADENPPDDETPIDFLGMASDEDGHAWVRLAPPEELGAFLGAAGKQMLDAYEDAINYVEWECIDRETRERTVLSVARSKGQTPGALRAQADATVARVRALLDAPGTITKDALRRALDG